MSGRGGRLFLVGQFPPPVHGMALVNERVANRLRERGLDPSVIDIAERRLRTEWWRRGDRVGRVTRAWLRLVRHPDLRAGSTMYLSVSGGLGQAYDAAFVLVARLRGARIVLHHHSCHYVARRRLLAATLLRIAGPAATHVVLCNDQGERLRRAYSRVRHVVVVPNAAFYGREDTEPATVPHARLRTVGFLGNVTRDKGIEEFVAVAGQLLAQGDDALEAVIAGPFMDRRAERLVRGFVSRQSRARYVGPVYGADKHAFFAQTDVLLFPSRYRDETDPLTIHEALQAGVPVIALERGCIAELVRDGAGLVVRGRNSYVEEAVRQVRYWRHAPAEYAEASRAARRRCDTAAGAAREALDRLLDQLAGAGAARRTL